MTPTISKEANTMATKMTAVEITERINKAQENLNKLMNLIAKREAKLEKLNKQISKMDRSADRNAYQEVQWTIEDTEYAIKENKDKIPEREQTIKYWQEKLEKANAENRRMMKMPEQLKQLYEQIKAEMIEYYTNLRNECLADREKTRTGEMTWEDFRKKYKSVDYYKTIYMTDAEIEKESNADAKSYVLDLVSRVQKKVGEITDWNLFISGSHLNGTVTGTRCKAKVETIIAGGYNIQCLHNRVLVNRIK